MVKKLAIPENANDLREFLDNPDKVAETFATPESTAEFFESYRKAVNAKDPELTEQADVARSEGLIKMIEDAGFVKQDPKADVKRPPMGGGGASVARTGSKAVYNDLGMSHTQMRQVGATGGDLAGMDLAGQFDGLSDFGLAALNAIAGKSVDMDARLKNLTEIIPGDGGFLVPEEFRAELLMLSLEMSVVRPRANVVPMGSAVLRYPAILDTSHATNVFGGVSGVWVGEGGTVSSTTNQPSFSGIRLAPNKLTAYARYSNELRADGAISIESLITSLYPRAIAYFEDDAFLNGTGAGQPMGIINADALISVGKETGQAAKTLLWENILNMYSRMYAPSLGSAVWVAHSDVFPQLATMSLSVGTGGAPVWLANGSTGAPMTILGRPVIFTEKAQTLGTAGDIFFVDLSYYLIGDRQAMTMAASEHVQFTTDEQVVRFVQRVDGAPWLQSALTPRNGTTTVSPYVSLATRA